MRRIKSAPANIAEMVNKKKECTINTDKDVTLCTLNSYSKKKEIVRNNNKIKQTIPGIIQDCFTETTKFTPNIDNYYLETLIEIINNFITNKFNKQNLENLLLSLSVRFFLSHIFYHKILEKVTEQIHF